LLKFICRTQKTKKEVDDDDDGMDQKDVQKDVAKVRVSVRSDYVVVGVVVRLLA